MNPLRGIELFSPGRWRMIHTNAIAYGFLANAFLGILHWAVPRLTLRPVLTGGSPTPSSPPGRSSCSRRPSASSSARRRGWSGARPRSGSTRSPCSGLLLVAINFVAPIARTNGPMYVSLWYFLAAFVWTFLTYAMGNFIPQYFVSGTSAGAVGGLFIHDLVGLFVTPLGWGMVYYFVPIMLKKPIWSHGLSLVGFWGLAFFYPLTGIHHFLYTPIPMFLQYGAIISTIAVELVVTTVIINFFMTIRGSTGALSTNLPIRWLYTGMVFYFLTCLQCAFQTTLTFQALIHFTDWVVGHAHMVMFGVFAMWQLGVMTYLIPRLLKTPWYSERLLEWHYWLSAVGIGLMSFDLITLGLFQGCPGRRSCRGTHSIEISIPFWAVRLVAGLLDVRGPARLPVQHRRDAGTSLASRQRAKSKPRRRVNRIEGLRIPNPQGLLAHAGNENRRVLHRGARLLRPGVPVQRAWCRS